MSFAELHLDRERGASFGAVAEAYERYRPEFPAALLDVELAAFEAWDPAGRTFDLVTCGDAWHWIEPKRGAATVARVLRPGGAFVRFWNMQLLDEPVIAALEAVCARLRGDDQRSSAAVHGTTFVGTARRT